MAAFSDQFSTLDPLTFEGSVPFDSLISTIMVEARTFLADERHVSELVAICQALERFLSQRIPNDSSRIAIAMEEAVAVGKTDEVLRSCSDLPSSIRPWEIYAALSIWKLIDAT